MTGLARLRGSLRIRLLAGTLAWILASIAAAGWGLGLLIHDHVERQFLAGLETHLDQLTAGVRQGDGATLDLAAPLSDPRFARPYSGLYWQVDRASAAGDVSAAGLLRSRSLWDTVLRVPPDALADGQLHRHRVPGPSDSWLVVVERSVHPAGSPERALRLLVGADERGLIEPIRQFRGTLWIVLALLAIGLAAAAVLQVVVGLAPLRRLEEELAAVREGRAQLMAGRYPVEVEPLVDEFNKVLGRNAEIVERARTAAGNLAHALKTPLSVLANAARGPGSDDLPRLVREQVEVARRQVDYHLKRARSAAASRVPGMRTPVEPVAAGLVRVMRRVHADRGLEIAVAPIPAALAFRGEEQDLHELLGNVLDNACKWAHGRVGLSAVLEGGALVVTVDDDGPGIDADRSQALLARGARADERVEGSGLGLAIVDDLARLYEGEIRLEASPLGGLRVVLRLPAVS